MFMYPSIALPFACASITTCEKGFRVKGQGVGFQAARSGVRPLSICDRGFKFAVLGFRL
jgi:hypothetical protein